MEEKTLKNSFVEIVNSRNLIRDIPNFPKPGIVFKDITPFLADSNIMTFYMVLLTQIYDPGVNFFKTGRLKVAGIESRGFIFGSALAITLGVPFIPIRKKGKLPGEVYSYEYDLEYGTDTLEVKKDAFKEKDQVILIDDLLATGGTAEAALHLIKSIHDSIEIVGVEFLIELEFLNGREKLKDYKVNSMLKY